MECFIPCVRAKLRFQVVQLHGSFIQSSAPQSLFFKEPAFRTIFLKEKNPVKRIVAFSILKVVDLDITSFQSEEPMWMILLILTSSAFIIQVCCFYPQGPVGANTGCTSEHRPIPDVLNLTSPLLPSPQCRPSLDQVQRASGPSHAPSNLGLGQDAALVSTAVIQSRSSLSRSILFGALIAVWQVLQRSAYRQSLCTRMGL